MNVLPQWVVSLRKLVLVFIYGISSFSHLGHLWPDGRVAVLVTAKVDCKSRWPNSRLVWDFKDRVYLDLRAQKNSWDVRWTSWKRRIGATSPPPLILQGPVQLSPTDNSPLLRNIGRTSNSVSSNYIYLEQNAVSIIGGFRYMILIF